MESPSPLAPDLARGAGAATLWKAFQVLGVKGTYFLRLVILARLLTPADYGLFAIALGALKLASSVTNVGVSEALIQSKSLARRDYDAGWSIGIARGVVLSGALLAVAPLIALFFAEPRAESIIRVIALVPLVDAVASVRIADSIRNLRFRSIAFAELTRTGANTVVAIALARSLGVWALLAGQIAGSVSYVLCSYVIAPYRPRLVFSAATMKPLLRFGRWILVTGLIAESGTLILRGIISQQLGTAELGLYFMAVSVAYLPVALAAETIGAVAFPLYARIRQDGKSADRLLRAIIVSMIVTVIPATLLMASLAPFAVEDLFGAKWNGTIEPLRILSFVCIAGLLGEALTPLFMATGRPDFVARTEMVQTAAIIILVTWLGGSMGLAGVAFASLIGTALAQPIAIRYARHSVRELPAGIWRCTLATVMSASLGCAAAWLLEHAAVTGLPGLLFSVAVGLSVSAVSLWLADRRLGLGIREDFMRALPPLWIFRKPAG